jgi:hypothetical protein
MTPLFAAPLGLATVLASTPADAAALAAVEPALEARPLEPEARPLEPEARPLAEPIADPLAPELVEAAARLEESDPAKACDAKCQVVALTEATLPSTGASDLVSVLLEPEQHGLSIPKSDGTPALTFTVKPTKLARGQGLVATAKF